MFLGEYSHSADTKGRVFIPAKFRDGLGEGFVVTRGIDPCLCVYPKAEWEKFSAKIDEFPTVQARKVRRFIYSAATDPTPDSQGRILIPSVLREYAGIEMDVVVIGVGAYLEIWSAEAWEKEKELESSQEIEALMLALES